MKNRPFLMRPTGKDYLWGGHRLNDEYGKNIALDPLAETWECSTHPDGPSYVVGGEFDGMTLSDVLGLHPEFLGKHALDVQKAKLSHGLPILIKFIDAKRDLSVQVHPSDAFAAANENGQLGKTEMWYVLDAAEDAKIVYGLRRELSEEEMRAALKNGTIMNYLQTVPARKGDVFYIEAGTIHAIGAGVVIAEIQESSNLTYRLYDYDRRDKNGRKRELHIDKALRCADLKAAPEPRQPMRVYKYRPGIATEILCGCKYFNVERLRINTEEADRAYADFVLNRSKQKPISEVGPNAAGASSAKLIGMTKNGRIAATLRDRAMSTMADDLGYKVILCVDGSGRAEFTGGSIEFRKGDCIFVPAGSVYITLRGDAELLSVRG